MKSFSAVLIIVSVLLARSFPSMAASVNLAPLQADLPGGLQCDTVHTCFVDVIPEVYVFATRTWATGQHHRFAIGSVDPDWNAGSLQVYGMDFSIAMDADRFAGTMWLRNGTAEYSGDSLVPNPLARIDTDLRETGAWVRQMVANLLGGRILSENIFESIAALPDDSVSTPWIPVHDEMIQAYIQDGLLSRLVVRNEAGDTLREFEYHYEKSDSPRLKRVEFTFAPQATKMVSNTQAGQEQVKKEQRADDPAVDRYFGGWTGSILFEEFTLEELKMNLISSIVIRLSRTGAVLYTAKMMNYRSLSPTISSATLDNMVNSYLELADIQRSILKVTGRYYLTPSTEIPLHAAEDLKEALVQAELLARDEGSPAAQFYANNLALEAAVLTGEVGAATLRFNNYLDFIEDETDFRAAAHAGMELLRYVLRRKDESLFNQLLPLWLKRCAKLEDPHQIAMLAVDFATAQRYWAAQAMARFMLDSSNLDPLWRFRFLAIDAWCSGEMAYSLVTHQMQHFVDQGNVLASWLHTTPEFRIEEAQKLFLRSLEAGTRAAESNEPFDIEMLQYLLSPKVVTPMLTLPATMEEVKERTKAFNQEK